MERGGGIKMLLATGKSGIKWGIMETEADGGQTTTGQIYRQLTLFYSNI